jgi:CheY-like chemotaxis protein
MEVSCPPNRRPKVLVVDDDPVVLALVREWLEGAGYDVSVRDQALGTAQVVVSLQPDFVLLDVKMPALSGGELTQLIRRNQSTASSAVILHSVMEIEPLSELGRTTGALGIIKKTPNSKLFLAEFERLVGRHRVSKIPR